MTDPNDIFERADKSHIKVGDVVQNIYRPEMFGIVVKVLYGENDPALIYIPCLHRAQTKSIFKDSLQKWTLAPLTE